MLHTQRDHSKVAENLIPQTAVRARISTQRADRLREFILGHLPDGVSVDVVISSGVQTAAVLPADVDAIISSEATAIERTQAEQFLDRVDADYLVLVTGNEADLTRIPLNDQLTADHAHQFGLAFHELLHILKTAITAIAELLDSEIDAEYHPQVHDLINIIEDGAIESEAIHGENFSDNAGIRLELTRRLHSQTPEDVLDGEAVRYSFWDAVTSCLYDEAIYPTGTTEVLLDENDGRIQFRSEADRDAFVAIHSELCNLSREALAIRSAERSDTTHSHDKTASIRRARQVIDTWKTHIQPVLESEDQQEEQLSRQSKGSQSGEAVDQPESTSDPRGDGDISNRNEGPQNPDSDADTDRPDNSDTERRSETEQSPKKLPEDFDPSEVSLSREATGNPHQNIFEQPQVTPDPDSSDLEDSDSGAAENVTEDPAVKDPGDSQDVDTGNETKQVTGDEAEQDGPTNREVEGEDELGSGAEPSNRAQTIAQAAERARRHDQEQNQPQEPGTSEVHPPFPGTNGSNSSDPAPQSVSSSSIRGDRRDDQLTLGTFCGDEDDSEKTGGESLTSTDAPAKIDGIDETSQPDKTQSDADPGNVNESDGTADPQDDGDNDERQDPPVHDGPAHSRRSGRSDDEEQAVYEDALASDERAAHYEANRERIDHQALGDELSALADQLERSANERAQEQEENSRQSDGSHGAPETLDELDILPISDDLAPPREWAAIEEGADRVADTLDMYLRLDRRKSVRRGLSAGAYDTRAGHRFAIGDSRVCKSRTLGTEKQYALVLVLDRSASMRQGSPPKIEVATQALARFALAAENLGIRVAIIDFYLGEARLVKPFSVDTRHVQASLLDTSCGGGTPLADALGLARELVEAQRDEPLIITLTDDDPASTEAVIEQLRRSHAPVCSLTIATDCQPGTLSANASELARYYERQEAVYTPERLDDRLDQFASLLAGL